MGNLCAGKHQKQQTTQTLDNINRNFTISQYVLKQHATIDLIIGTYRCHHSDTLLALVQKQYLDYCLEMRDYADNIEQTMTDIIASKKLLTAVTLNKSSPYKKLKLCVLPPYSSIQKESKLYISEFQEACRNLLDNSKDITIQLTHTSQNSNGIPNQTLVALFLKVLVEKIDKIKNQLQVKDQKVQKIKEIKDNKKGYKISVIASDGKLLNLVRFQIIKLEDYQIRKVQMQIQERGFHC